MTSSTLSIYCSFSFAGLCYVCYLRLKSTTVSLPTFSDHAKSGRLVLTTPTSKKRDDAGVLRLDPEELQTPSIAWPTVFLAILALSAWSLSFYCLCTGYAPEIPCVVVSTIAAYASFTPVHDAVHWAIGRRSTFGRILNELVGRICTMPLLSPFPAFRYVHLLHHKHTNVPELDPDMKTQDGFICRLFMELFYYVYIFKGLEDVPEGIFRESLLIIAVIIGLLATGIHHLGFYYVALGVLIPQRVAVHWLAYCFDYVPHVGAVDRPTDQYRTTKHIVSFFPPSLKINVPNWILRMAIFEQDTHVIHHLYPTLPFYYYRRVWDRHEDELYGLGVEDTTLF